MIYLQDNPLLKEPLKPEHIKNRLLGHWGSSPGLAFTYVHLNRLIKKFDLNMIFMAGPGHGAPGVLAPGYLRGRLLRRFIRTRAKTSEGCANSSSSSRFPAGSGVTARPRRPARYTKAVNWATCCRTPAAPLSIIRI
jgi:xylulose-5-phosphate/fructose-6-phosphate phosphoketolase